ncbi:MAG TPA: ABC transporter permease [Candidatus Baltobacteraceae bacterium]|nr:ABC transporter permease [Candidatus Baltobacteraceae bacterium]
MKQRLLRRLKRGRLILIGVLLTIVPLVAGLLAPWVAPDAPDRLDPMLRLVAPGGPHIFGTDELGRDLLTQVIYGARLSLLIGSLVVIISTVLGTIFGLMAGYLRNLDALIMRTMDGLLALPDLLLGIALMASLGPNVANVVLALGVVYTPRIARLVRGSVLVVRELEYVQAAQALGATAGRSMFRHVLPSSMSPLIVQATFVFAFSILSEAALSFLGVGVPPTIPSWGNILAGGRQFMVEAPWVTMIPGLAIVITVLGINLLGDGLRDALDPRLRRLV